MNRDRDRSMRRGIKIEDAIERRERVTFTYHGERREVSPYELRGGRRGHEHSPGDVIRTADVVGWDHDRQGYRTFKLADVRRVARTGLPSVDPS